MVFKKLIVAVTFLCFFQLQSCSGWFILQLETENQPIQLGPHLSSAPIDTLGTISGKSTHDYSEGSYFRSGHFSMGTDESDEIEENINSTIFSALDDDSLHFIADGKLVIEVEQGISVGSIIFGMILSAIFDGDDDFDPATYETESIKYKGTVYKYRTQKVSE